MTVLRAKAHAKVNVHLGVGDARADGYHELASVFQSLSLHDIVTVEAAALPVDSARPNPAGLMACLRVHGRHAAGVPEDETNLSWRAAEMVWARFRERLAGRQDIDCGAVPPVAMTIEKGIPAAGGMAGGSADGAAALVLANQWCARYLGVEPLEQAVLFELAAQLGSDVPFTLMGGTALGTGRGEQLVPMMNRGSYTWAVITNDVGLSTPAVFAKLDELRAQGRGGSAHLDTAEVAQALLSGSAAQLAAVTHNDMEPAALSLRPDLRKILETGKAAGALAGMVSGSGPTCAFLVDTEADAHEVIAQVCADNPGTRGYVATAPAQGIVLIP